MRQSDTQYRGHANMSVGRAVLVGTMWVNGSVLAAFTLCFAGTISGLIWAGAGKIGDVAIMAGMILSFMISFTAGWWAWSIQVGRWRIWAYRRVTDIEALKAAAVSAGVIWPQGHVFQRTERLTPAQSAELARLEMSFAREASTSSPSDCLPA